MKFWSKFHTEIWDRVLVEFSFATYDLRRVTKQKRSTAKQGYIFWQRIRNFARTLILISRNSSRRVKDTVDHFWINLTAVTKQNNKLAYLFTCMSDRYIQS